MLIILEVNNIANGWTNYKRYMGESFVFYFGDPKCEHVWTRVDTYQTLLPDRSEVFAWWRLRLAYAPG